MDGNLETAFWEKYYKEFLESILTLVRIPSVSIPSSKGKYPFGEACAAVLDTFLDMGKSKGFPVENHDYYCGSILLPGTGSGEIGIFAHLDVVPEGDGWQKPPYTPYVSDGWLYGRGSSDNKGPAIAALYAMLWLKESGVKLQHTIRLFLGCNEECGMQDIAYYLKKYSAPDFSFTPDASFSVCYSEKGIMEVEFTAQLPEKLIAFTAGSASNSVAGSAYALLPGNENQITTEDSGQYPGICVGHEGEYLCIKATGRSAHAASPEGSVNAAVILASYLVRSRLLDIESIRRLSFLSDCFADYYGKALEIDYENAEAGKLTVIAGKTCTRDGILRQNINIRYPAGTDVQEMTDRLAETAESYGWQMEIIRNDPPAYVSPHHPIVQALDGICKDYFGSRTGPYAMGGGTYARKLPNAVAFGPSIRGMKKPGLPGHGGGHQPDECVWIQGLQTAVSIYVQALIKIDGMLCGKNQ